MQRNKNKSSDKSREEKTSHPSQYASIQHDRKCHTPSLNNPKKRSKSKDKSTEKKATNPNLKPNKHVDVALANLNIGNKKTISSPFKHKSRPISNLAGARHAKNIEHQLSHLNESVFRNQSSIMDQSSKKLGKSDPQVVKLMEDARKHMKNNHFQKAIACFQDCLHRQEDNIEAMYLFGVSTFHLEDWDNCIKCLSNVLMKDDHYRKNVYLFLAISYKKTGLIEQAILTLTRSIAFYPKYYDALILRAKILSKQKRYYDAIEDLNKCIKLEPNNTQAYISKADCLRSLTQYKQSIIIYSEVLDVKLDFQILLKRAIAFIENDQVSSALEDLNSILLKNQTNSEAYLFKGLAYTKINNYNDAILSYEQAIKFNTSRKATTKALYEIAKLKIDMGDMYGASYTLERANSLDIDMKVLDKMKIFTEGSTSIMKKKFRRGIENLSILSRKQNLSDQLRPLIYSFRSYGYFSQNKFSNALNDLKAMQKYGFQFDRACNYNHTILEGIIASQNNQFQEAIKFFSLAEVERKELSDPQIYKGLLKICEYNRNPKNKNPRLLEEALTFIGHALEKQQNSSTYYICACILYEMGELDQALENIEKAMQKSEEHVMKHLYLRGLIKAHLGEFKEAYKGFCNVLGVLSELKERQKQPQDPDEQEREKQIPETYLNRAKCYLLFGEKKKAFQDLQTYIAKKPLDGEVHAVAGKLLFSIGSFEDAVKAYNYSPNIDKHKQVILERMKCYLLLKQLNYCLKDLEKIIDLGLAQARYDYHCLDSLKQASKGTQQCYVEALNKIQKAQVMSFDGGIIFKQSDLFFYKGFFKFQLEDYAQALKLFSKSKNLKALNNQLELLSINEEGNVDEEQLQNKIYTDKQIQYNIAVTQLLLGKDSSQVLKNYDGFCDYFEGNLVDGDLIDATPFPTTNRLCSIFTQKQFQNKLKFKLSFCLPEVVPPEIKFDPDLRIIRNINIASTQSRPDAPWIKRNTHGVIFTDEIVGIDIDLKTEKSINNLDHIKIQSDFGEEDSEPNDKAKIKNMLILDQNLEDKLDKLMKKKKQNKG